MDSYMLLISVITICIALMGLLGWSHKALRQRIMEMEIAIGKRMHVSDARALMADKLAPIQVEYNSLARRIDDLKTEHHKLNDKIDKVLVLCTKMVHEKESRK